MSKYSFLEEQNETPLFMALAEGKEGRLHQIAAASAWGQTKFGRSLCQIGGKLTGPALGEWMQLMSKINPEWTHQNAKNGRAKLQDKLDSDPEFYADWCENHSKGALRFKEEYPELFKEYQKRRTDASMQWRIDNPEEHAENQKNWQEAGRKAAWEKEVWRDSILIANGAWRAFLLTPEGDAWKLKQSDRMKIKRQDPKFNKANADSCRNSKAHKKAAKQNVKLATEAAHYEVICPRCGKSGDAVVMPRHHFDKCTFNEQLELKVIKGISDKHIFRNQKEIQEIFLKAGFKSNYYFKYDIFDKYFLKLDPSKKTSGFCVLNTFDFDVYYLDLEHKETERKAKVLEGQRQRAKNMAKKRKGTHHTEETKIKIANKLKTNA
mgnify:CR=1 FL=1